MQGHGRPFFPNPFADDGLIERVGRALLADPPGDTRMNYGLYLSASGVLTNMHRLDVMANNLANLATVGFKPDEVTFASRLPERLDPGSLSVMGGEPADPQWMLEQLGGGTWAAPTRIDLRQGVLRPTGNDLDLAIDGDGFFTVQASSRDGAEALHLTRDGRFTINADGELAMSAGGHRVLDDQGQPIALDRTAPVSIDARGGVSQRGAIVATLAFANVADRGALKKVGDNLLRLEGGSTVQRRRAAGTIHQRHVENSAVDPVMALNNLINASKAVQASATLMQYHDNILGQVINTYGRVA